MITLKVWSYLTVFILCGHRQKPASANSQKKMKNLHRPQRSWLVICFCIQGSSLHPATSINIAPKDHNWHFSCTEKLFSLCSNRGKACAMDTTSSIIVTNISWKNSKKHIFIKLFGKVKMCISDQNRLKSDCQREAFRIWYNRTSGSNYQYQY
jgi:hypothetical protein